MQLTYIGIFQFSLGIGLFAFGSIRALFVFAMISMLFSGSAALNLTSLGGSSVTPAHFSLIFLILRCILPGGLLLHEIIAAIQNNIWLSIFVLYGIFAAFIMPHVFASALDVTPLRGQLRDRYGSELARILAAGPLQFSTQNITTAVYMGGTLLMAIASFAVMRMHGASQLLVRTAAIVAISHAAFGFASVFLKSTPVGAFLDIFRNGNYAQLDTEWAGFVRMNGVQPEASSFAGFAIVWFVFNFECWLRNIQPRLTGSAALILGLALLISTSSSAYVGLGIFGAAMLIRTAITPHLFSPQRLTWLTMIALSLVVIVCTVLLVKPALISSFTDLLAHMTLDKAGSFSGRQRLFWASQGIDGFMISYGLGIGPGSFRSSSLTTAIIGSVGIVGTIAIAGHIIKAFSPLSLSTWVPTHNRYNDPSYDIAAAAGWAMVIDIAVASVSAPSCDPGLNFAILSGAAIALRLKNKPAEPMTALNYST